jgi:hypothetical protein
MIPCVIRLEYSFSNAPDHKEYVVLYLDLDESVEDQVWEWADEEGRDDDLYGFAWQELKGI